MEQEFNDKWYQSYWTKLYHIAYAILNNREDSEDAVGNCILKVITNNNTSVDNIGGYLYKAVRNEAFEILRKRKQGPFVNVDGERIEMIMDEGELSAQTLKLQAEVYGLLMKEVDRMAPKEREVFMLWLSGKRFTEIAACLDIPYTTVRRYYMNALRYLIAKVKDRDLLSCTGLILLLLGCLFVPGPKKSQIFLAFFPVLPSYT